MADMAGRPAAMRWTLLVVGLAIGLVAAGCAGSQPTVPPAIESAATSGPRRRRGC